MGVLIEQVTFENVKEKVDSLLEERIIVIDEVRNALEPVYRRAMLNVKPVEKSWFLSRAKKSNSLSMLKMRRKSRLNQLGIKTLK